MSVNLRSYPKWFLGITGIMTFSLCMIFSGLVKGQGVQVVSAVNVERTIPEAKELLHYAPPEVNEKNREALNKIISVDLTDIPMEKALQRIANLADLRVAYSKSKSVDKSQWQKPVSIQFDRATVLGALYAALGDTGLKLTLSSTSGNSHLIVVKGSVTEMGQPESDVVPLEQENITGRVTDASTGEPLPGVTVLLEGTSTGTSTDADGNYSLTVSGDGTLVFSFVGYESLRVPVNGQDVINIELDPTDVLLEEMVVTAIGLERDRRTIGYAITQVSPEDVVQGTEPNVANLLQGQIPGVQINPVGGGPGASTRVVIRGVSTFEGDNQPLYIVDGVPIDNTNLGSSVGEGFDGGDGIQSLNPDDIQSISVLKGASAAALYGERAINGVILITTRQGRAGHISANFSSTTTFERPRNALDEVQTTYGQGGQGLRPQSASAAWSSNRSSWGEPFDGQPSIQWDGVMRPYEDVNNNVFSEIYRTGINARNTISVTGGGDESTYYFSATQLNSPSIVPNSDLTRTSLTVRGTSRIGRLSADLKANYIDEEANNRPSVVGVVGNIQEMQSLARNVPISSFKENYKDENGMEISPQFGDVWGTNPYWTLNEKENRDTRNRLIGHVKLDFELTEWLQLTGRTGLDWYALHQFNVVPFGTAYRTAGSMTDGERRIQEANSELFLNGAAELTPSISIDGILGGALRNHTSQSLRASGADFTIPGLNTLSNMESVTTSVGYSEKEVRSFYGAANIGYNDFLFLNLTGRNDWSSTLPVENNSFFYPSVGVSFLFSDAFAPVVPDWISHGQLRASWAEVGSDTSPYRLNLAYSVAPFTHMGQPLGRIAQSSIPLADMQPAITQELELGFDIRFLDDRLGIDFAWYDRQTTNQIMSTSVPGSTGYTGRVLNVGRLDNTGVEVQLLTRPIVRPNFFWRSTVNWSRNKGVVRELVEGQDLIEFQVTRERTSWVVAKEGEDFGTIRGFDFVRDEDGNIVFENGLPIQGDLAIIGRTSPDWLASWSNTFRWRNISLNTMIDGRWGGQMMSSTNSRLMARGLHKETLLGRAACDETKGADGRWAPDCFVFEGVDINGGPNTTGTTPQAYFNRLNQIPAHHMFDNNFFIMRQLQVGYNLPVEWIGGLGMRSASVSIVGRNLFYIYKSIPNIDPEAVANRRHGGAGHEFQATPGTRSIGFNISVQF